MVLRSKKENQMAADSFGLDQGLFNTWQTPSNGFQLAAKKTTVPNPYAPSQFSYIGDKPSIVAQTVQQARPSWATQIDGSAQAGLGNGSLAEYNANANLMEKELIGGNKTSGSYLEGFTGGVKDIGKSMWDFVTPTKAADSHAQYVQDWTNGIGKDFKAAVYDDTGKIMLKPAEGTSLNEYIDQTQKQQGVNNQQWATGMQAGLGAVNGIFGAMSYFDNKAMNKKNMQLVDQQIANNQDVMKTRTERAGDIKKYFG